MDIDSIATTVGIAIISGVAKKITDKENITKLVDWVLSVGEYFWQRSEGEQPLQTTSQATAEKPDETKKPLDINQNDFSSKRNIKQIISLMKQLDTYTSNLNGELERAAKLGGIDSPDMTIKLSNSIKDQKIRIVECFSQLTEVVNKLQNEKNDELDNLIKMINE